MRALHVLTCENSLFTCAWSLVWRSGGSVHMNGSSYEQIFFTCRPARALTLVRPGLYAPCAHRHGLVGLPLEFHPAQLQPPFVFRIIGPLVPGALSSSSSLFLLCFICLLFL